MWVRPLLVLPLLALTGCRERPGSASPTDPASEIQAMLDASARAWNAGDLEGFLVTYADDSATTFLTVRGLTHGFAAIRERYAPRFEPGVQRDSLRFTALEVRLLGSEHALATARYILTRGDSVTAEGPFTVVLHRRPEGWRMIHDHSS